MVSLSGADSRAAHAYQAVYSSGTTQETILLPAGKYKAVVSGTSITAVAEVITLTITGPAVTTGSVNIVIRGASPVNIVLTNGDSASTIATNIAAGSFTGWTVTSLGAVVTFTATATGAKAGANTFTLVTTTGVTGTFAIPTPGVTGVSWGGKLQGSCSSDSSLDASTGTWVDITSSLSSATATDVENWRAIRVVVSGATVQLEVFGG